MKKLLSSLVVIGMLTSVPAIAPAGEKAKAGKKEEKKEKKAPKDDHKDKKGAEEEPK